MNILKLKPIPGQRLEPLDMAKGTVVYNKNLARDGMSGTNRLTGGKRAAHGTAVMHL